MQLRPSVFREPGVRVPAPQVALQQFAVAEACSRSGERKIANTALFLIPYDLTRVDTTTTDRRNACGQADRGRGFVDRYDYLRRAVTIIKDARASHCPLISHCPPIDYEQTKPGQRNLSLYEQRRTRTHHRHSRRREQNTMKPRRARG